MLPVYLSIGMSADEFWHGNPRLATSYREAWKNRLQSAYQAEWRQGMYVANAISACFSESAEYPEEPIFSVETDEERQERRERAHMLKMRDNFEAQIAAARKKLENTGGDGHAI